MHVKKESFLKPNKVFDWGGLWVNSCSTFYKYCIEQKMRLKNYFFLCTWNLSIYFICSPRLKKGSITKHIRAYNYSPENISRSFYFWTKTKENTNKLLEFQSRKLETYLYAHYAVRNLFKWKLRVICLEMK